MSTPLQDYKHPEKAVYILGSNEEDFPVKDLEDADAIRIDTEVPLWSEIALGIVLWHRNNNLENNNV